MLTLMDSGTGTFAVATRSARYLIDLDHMTVSRSPGPPGPGVAALRRDGETMTLLVLAECTVDRELVFVVDLHIPGVCWTLRGSTTVRSIEPAPGVGAR